MAHPVVGQGVEVIDGEWLGMRRVCDGMHDSTSALATVSLA
jgi:hypothetical protein